MAVKTIITDYEAYDNRAEEIDLRKESKLAQETILDLKHTMQKNNYVCLAAPHIGVNKRIVCINFKGQIRTFINPLIGSVKGFELSRESCPAIPGKQFIRPRHNDIHVMYQTPLGKVESLSFKGMAAKVMQYGIDILDGLLLSDVGLELDDNWDKATQKERDAVIDMYLESLDLQRKQIKVEIENDPESKQLMDAIAFMESVERGETQVEFVKKDFAEK